MILIDTPRSVRFRRFVLTAHMMSDLLDPEEARRELDSFACRIGLRLAWRQNSGKATEHYDLFDGAIERALAAGAVPVAPRELITRVVRPKREARQVAGGAP